MKILKYESFLETMQFSVLQNAKRLADEEAERKKSKREEEDSKKNIPVETKDEPKHHGYQDSGGEEPEMEGEVEEPEMEGEVEEPEMEGEEDIENLVYMNRNAEED